MLLLPGGIFERVLFLIKWLWNQHKLTFFKIYQPVLHYTRKSSCVNARGIPTAAYQVLLGGVPPHGVPPARSDGGYQRWGTPQSGYPHQSTPPSQVWWGDTQGGVPPSWYPTLGYPLPLAGPGLGNPPTPRPGPGSGTPPPPPGVDRLKTLPSPVLPTRPVKIECGVLHNWISRRGRSDGILLYKTYCA